MSVESRRKEWDGWWVNVDDKLGHKISKCVTLFLINFVPFLFTSLNKLVPFQFQFSFSILNVDIVLGTFMLSMEKDREVLILRIVGFSERSIWRVTTIYIEL